MSTKPAAGQIVQATARCEREELVEKIADRLNKGRVKDGGEPLTYRDVALTLHSRQRHEAAVLLNECERTNHWQICLAGREEKGRTQRPLPHERLPMP
ncbi:MAG TPA: hypothetical protein GX405_04750 [Rhizobiales bacterium]|nr:hypothetical protein [Hyphomicrobiales bacterium]